MGSNLAQEDGHLGERIHAYYEARAKGGAALLIVGVGAITWPEGACNPNQVAISDDRFLPGLEELTRRAHKHGAKIAIQLQHASKVATRDMAAGRPMLVPSVPIPKPSDLMDELTDGERNTFVSGIVGKTAKIEYKVMSVQEIAYITGRFAEAAQRAQRAGFDGVEIHAGHGYLLSSFLSPYSNRRDDEYGGPLENRARFLVEVLQAVRARCGETFPVWCRIDSKEFGIEGGINFEDAKRTAQIAEAAGADAIHVSAYGAPYKGAAFTQAPLVHKPSGFVPFAEGIKKCVGVPVIAVGRIEPEIADGLIAEGKADFVAMGRKLLADPDLPKKLQAGRPQNIRPCIYCYTCVGKIFLNGGVCCAVNPYTGHEFELTLTPAQKKRKVLVVGGGPAGMEAARIACLRGHDVTLVEKTSSLGGTLRFAALAYAPNDGLLAWLRTQVENLPISVHLGQELTEDLARELAPDVAIVAVGARRELPAIPGVSGNNVLSGDDLRQLLGGGDNVTAKAKLGFAQRGVLRMGKLLGVTKDIRRLRELSKAWMPIGKRVVILGGGLVGIELAEFLLERGRDVTVLEESKNLAPEMAVPRRWRSLADLREHGGTVRKSARIESIDTSSVAWVDKEGTQHRIPTDTVILAAGTVENRDLGERLAKTVPEVHLIGDCSGVGYLEGAIHEGSNVAHAI